MPEICQTTIRIGHSPDPDDAFMWWPLANFPNGTGPNGQTFTPKIDTAGIDFVHVLEDIQSLNERSEKAELEITALSIHQFPFVADEYSLTSCGSSMGDGYGPMFVAKPGLKFEEIKGKKLAIPGYRTTAWLLAQLMFAEYGIDKNDVHVEDVPFDQILNQVENDQFDYGLIIHEGQITYENNGLVNVADTGQWWQETRGLPMPLGGNAIRHDVESPRRVCRVLLNSIQYALNNRQESIKFALNYARDMDSSLADRFVGMYVNDLTLDYGDDGRRAVERLIADGIKAGLVPNHGPIRFIDPL